MLALLEQILPETLQVILLVFVMMVLVDVLNVWTHGRMAGILRGPHQWRQYFIAPLVAGIPGCVGGFSAVSLYVHGMISFGALVGAMVAASGDEAFVMIALFPRTALVLFAVLAVLGIGLGWLTDVIVRRTGIITGEDCNVPIIHPTESGLWHYLREHVWEHIIRRHLWKVALWTLGALLIVQLGMQYAELDELARRYPVLVLLASAFLGLIPQSGPHMLVVGMYANGLIPFSVLLTSAIVQDGHSMLPMLAHSVRDSIKIKTFNLAFGLTIGGIVYLSGW